MKYLYAPWRASYTQEGKTSSRSKACPFCLPLDEQENSEQYIVARFTHCFVLLNLFPYNPGHLLVIPYRHQAALAKLSSEERIEIMETTARCTTILQKIFKAKGFNIGINQGGQAAGGSIPRHLHMHVVPRWPGDTGFLTTLAETKQISASLPEMHTKLVAAFKKYHS